MQLINLISSKPEIIISIYGEFITVVLASDQVNNSSMITTRLHELVFYKHYGLPKRGRGFTRLHCLDNRGSEVNMMHPLNLDGVSFKIVLLLVFRSCKPRPPSFFGRQTCFQDTKAVFLPIQPDHKKLLQILMI